MTTTVPLSALATSVKDIDAPLITQFLFPKDETRLASQSHDYETLALTLPQHRHMEYLWGLEIYTIDPTHERSILHIRKSMKLPFPPGTGGWTLAPTEETLAAMVSLQKHNSTSPVSERKSFLTEFAAAEYEYIFVPLYTNIDFFILEPGQAAQRFSAPYTNFPRVTSSANPFFVTFWSRLKIRRFHASTSKRWHQLFGDLTMQWCASPLPEEFLTSCYPETLISESDHGSQPEAHPVIPEAKIGSDKTVVAPNNFYGPPPARKWTQKMAPVDEEPSPAPDKDAFVDAWVRRAARRPHEPLILGIPPQDDRSRKVNDYARLDPRWRKETKRGMEWSDRLFKRPRLV
ncbi:hypothetical protein B0H19DRAFT_1248430 [Mycena capillaripes]|nr:hypothetical protein B0H19DRAFT_1248430 [Mycena capillaripes]